MQFLKGFEEMIPEARPGMTMLLLVLLAGIWHSPPGTSNVSSNDISNSVSVPASSSIQAGSIIVNSCSANNGDTVTITVKPGSSYEPDALTVTNSIGSSQYGL